MYQHEILYMKRIIYMEVVVSCRIINLHACYSLDM